MGCRVVRTGWKLKKGLDLHPSQNQKELGMFVVSDTNISSSFKQDSRETLKHVF